MFRIGNLFFLPLLFVALVSCGNYTHRRHVVYTPKSWPTDVPGDTFRPDSPDLSPAVLLIHGGVKIGDDGRWVMNGIARKLVKRGYYVLNITYRDGAHWPYPAPLEDVQQGLQWLRKNAKNEGVDPGRIGVFGYSAGGYLGALAALRKGDEDMGVKAIVAGGTPTDLSVYANGTLVQSFLGSGGEPSMERFYDASPLTHVTPESAPVFIYQGLGDKLVRPDHAEKFEAVLQHYGVPHQVYWIPKKGHISTFFFPSGAVDASIDFLDEYLK